MPFGDHPKAGCEPTGADWEVAEPIGACGRIVPESEPPSCNFSGIHKSCGNPASDYKAAANEITGTSLQSQGDFPDGCRDAEVTEPGNANDEPLNLFIKAGEGDDVDYSEGALNNLE